MSPRIHYCTISEMVTDMTRQQPVVLGEGLSADRGGRFSSRPLTLPRLYMYHINGETLRRVHTSDSDSVRAIGSVLTGYTSPLYLRHDYRFKTGWY